MDTWNIRLRDEPGAAERLLSILRRRMVPVERFSLVRAGERRFQVEMVLALESGMRDRMMAEIEALIDVEECTRGPGTSGPTSP